MDDLVGQDVGLTLVKLYVILAVHQLTLFWRFKASVRSCTGKSLSEALIFASTNPQYDDTLFVELQVQYSQVPNKRVYLLNYSMFCS